jgi:HK97 family phage prohead protease
MEIFEVPFEIKAESMDSSGFFEGYGSTFGGKPDSYGDVIAQGAFKESLEKGGRNGTGIAMLWQHDPTQPIGVWHEISENSKGLKVRGQLAIETQIGHDAHVLMKMKALQGLSIGYTASEWEDDSKTKIRTLKKIELWEISPVTFPANTRATITSVKTIKEAATDPRSFEKALRDAGLSKSAAEYVVSLCRSSLGEPENVEHEALGEISAMLKQLNADIMIRSAFN